MKIHHMNKTQSFKNNHGFSIGEILIALGVVSIISLISFQFLMDSQKSTKKIEARIEDRINVLLADKIILKDFRLAYPSVNQIFVKDVNGNNYYDYRDNPQTASNLAVKSVLGTASQNVGRYFKFDAKASDSGNMFYMVVVDNLRGEAIYGQPASFYDFGAQPANANLPTPITFSAPLFTTFVQDSNKKKFDPEGMYYIESTGNMKQTANNKYARPAVYMGYINASQGIEAANLPEGLFNPTIYGEESSGGSFVETQLKPNSFDEYLRNLPALGASGSDIRIVPINIIRYHIKCAEANKCSLYRSVFTRKGGFVNPTLVIDNLISVMFHRESVDDLLTSVVYEHNKTK